MNEGDTGRAQYSKADYSLLNSRRHIHIDVNAVRCGSPEYIYFNIAHNSKKWKLKCIYL